MIMASRTALEVLKRPSCLQLRQAYTPNRTLMYCVKIDAGRKTVQWVSTQKTMVYRLSTNTRNQSYAERRLLGYSMDQMYQVGF